MGRNGVVRKIAAGVVVVLAGMMLGACGLFGSSHSQVQATGVPGVPGSIIAADVHLGPATSCYGQVGVPARICSAWQAMPAKVQPTATGITLPAAVHPGLFPVSATIHVPYVIIQLCRQGSPGGAWVPVTVQMLESGRNPTYAPSHFSCVPYLDPSGGLAPITIVFGIIDLVVIAGAVVFVAHRRSASRVPAPVGV